MRKRHWIIRIGLLITAGIVVMIAFAIYSAHRTRVAAERFVREVAALQVGLSSGQEVERIRREYAAYTSSPVGEIEPRCQKSDCPAVFWFANTWMTRLHLARFKMLRSSLTISNGRLTRITVGSTCYTSNGGQVNASVIDDLFLESFPGGEAFRPFSIGGTYSGGRQTVLIDMSPAASPEQRGGPTALISNFSTGSGHAMMPMTCTHQSTSLDSVFVPIRLLRLKRRGYPFQHRRQRLAKGSI